MANADLMSHTPLQAMLMGRHLELQTQLMITKLGPIDGTSTGTNAGDTLWGIPWGSPQDPRLLYALTAEGYPEGGS